MTERTVTLKLDLVDQIGDRLIEIRKQRDALLAKNKIGLSINPSGLDQARRAAAEVGKQSQAATKDLDALGGALLSKAVGPAAQYQKMLGSILTMGKAMGPGIVSALKGVSAEFRRQRDLSSFWGVNGFQMGVISLKSAFSGFLSGSGRGFTSWLQNTSANLAQYRTALAATAAVMVGMAAAAALSSKHAQNYISSTLDSRLMGRKLTDKEGAASWVESAQGTDWSGGRESRMGVFQTVLSKNKAMGQKAAQKATEDIEKYFFANQEMLGKKGFTSAEQLASAISAPQLSGEDATKFEDIFGLGFSTLSSTARLSRLSGEAEDIDMDKAVEARPDEVLSKRLTATTQAMGDAVLPALNTVLGGFIKLSDVIGKIPGLGKAMGWGAVLLGAATAGLVVVSMIGSLIPGLKAMWALTQSDTAAKAANIAMTYAHAAASKVAAAGQWLLNAAMSANPLGIVIVAIAGLIVVLYALEKQFGIVTKAWKAFSESSIGKGIISYIEGAKKSLQDLLGSLGKAFKGGGLSGVVKFAMEGLAASSPLFKILLTLVDFIRRLWVNSNILNKLFSSASGLWQKMVDFFTWLMDSINSLASWIKDGLGITKSEKKKTLDTAAEKAGIHWNEEKGAWITSSGAEASNPKSGVSKSALDRINTLKDAYENAPKGFLEGIPGIDNLRKAIEDLTYALKHPVAAATAAASSAGSAAVSAAQPVLNADIQAVNQKLASGQPVSSLSVDMGNPSGLLKTIYNVATGKGLPSADVGGPIMSDGALIGHGGEEVSPANVVAGGKTTLARINEMVGGGSSNSQSIYAPVTVQVSIGKVDSDLDIGRLADRIGTEGADRLIFALRNKLNSGQLRDIGYLRG